MKMCGGRPRWPTWAALHDGLSQERSRGLLRWKASRAPEHRRIDVLRWERAHATGKGPLRRPRSSRPERCQRARFDGAVASRKSSDALPSPPCPEKHEAGESKSPKPAARRQARGRWRLDDRKVVRRGPRNRRKRGSQGRSEEPTTGGFSHGGRQTVSEGDVSAGARGAKRRL